jgi:hypothetical protein
LRALARLGLARAKALQGRASGAAEARSAHIRALATYRDFLTLWDEADSEIPLLKQAKSEYAQMEQTKEFVKRP